MTESTAQRYVREYREQKRRSQSYSEESDTLAEPDWALTWAQWAAARNYTPSTGYS